MNFVRCGIESRVFELFNEIRLGMGINWEFSFEFEVS